jgi:hypothetical protein
MFDDEKKSPLNDQIEEQVDPDALAFIRAKNKVHFHYFYPVFWIF